MERQKQSKNRGSRGCGLRHRPGEGIRACQPPCGVGLDDALQLPKEDLDGAVRLISSTRDVCSSKDVRQSRPRPSRLYCQGPSGAVCCFLLHDALSEVTKIYSSLKLRVFLLMISLLW